MMIIQNQTELDAFCKGLFDQPFITLDTEFLREKTYYPKLCLIQLSGPDGNAVAIDPLMDLNLDSFFALLENPKILKVLHAARQDLEIFYRLMAKVPAPLFDTQIAAMVCGYGDSVGYENLVRNIAGAQLDKSVQFTDWSRRPLSQRQIDYALGDVTHLIKVYQHLAAKLEETGRTAWLMQEEEILANPATYENPPREAYKRIKLRTPKPKMLAVLRELAAWREEQAQKRDLPRGWVMRDDTLADMAAQVPGTLEQLSKIRNMPQDLNKNNIGQTLLNLIQKGLATPKGELPRPEKKEPLAPAASACADILRMLLKVQCAQHGVAPKLVADQEDIEAIAMDDDADVPALKGWRFEIFGRDALALKNGALAIGLKNGAVVKYDVSDYKS